MIASVLVTTAMIVADATGCAPTSDNVHFSRLLTMRAGAARYVGGTGTTSPCLGTEVMRAAIPEAALQRLSVADIVAYRAISKEAYRHWLTEVDRVATRLDEVEVDRVAEELPRIIATEVLPKATVYRDELRSVRDKMFGGLVRDLWSWRFPTLTIAGVAGLNLPAAMAAFCAGASVALPSMVDYFAARRDAGRKHAISYVVGVTEEVGLIPDPRTGLLRTEE
jgi:hypothetical protein